MSVEALHAVQQARREAAKVLVHVALALRKATALPGDTTRVTSDLYDAFDRMAALLDSLECAEDQLSEEHG